MSRALYWRIPHKKSHAVSNSLMRILEFCCNKMKDNFIISDTDILIAIEATIETYGFDTRHGARDMKALRQMREEIEKHGEIELFYED